jgi:hypothetical protein
MDGFVDAGAFKVEKGRLKESLGHTKAFTVDVNDWQCARQVY